MFTTLTKIVLTIFICTVNLRNRISCRQQLDDIHYLLQHTGRQATEEANLLEKYTTYKDMFTVAMSDKI